MSKQTLKFNDIAVNKKDFYLLRKQFLQIH